MSTELPVAAACSMTNVSNAASVAMRWGAGGVVADSQAEYPLMSCAFTAVANRTATATASDAHGCRDAEVSTDVVRGTSPVGVTSADLFEHPTRTEQSSAVAFTPNRTGALCHHLRLDSTAPDCPKWQALSSDLTEVRRSRFRSCVAERRPRRTLLRFGRTLHPNRRSEPLRPTTYPTGRSSGVQAWRSNRR